MNNKFKNYLKIGMLLFAASLLLWNCEKEGIGHIEQVLSKEKFHSRRISGTEIPHIISLINKETKNVLTTKSSSSNYGELDLEDIVEVIDTIGNINYSFRISNIDDDGFSLYNLVVHTDEDGNMNSPYVVKYTMEENFANDFYANIKGFDEFTGTMARYTIDAFLEGHSTKYNKGTPVLDCPCDETTLDGGTNNPSGGGSGSDPDAPDGGSTDGGTSGGGGGGGYTCWVTVVATPCSCVGHTYQGCNCANEGGTNASYAYEIQCVAKSFQQKGSDDCPQDVNGNCPEDDGYVGVNTIFQIITTPDLENDYPCQSAIVRNSFLRTAPLSQLVLDIFESDSSNYNLIFDVNEALEGTDSQGITGNTSENSEWELGKLDITIGLNPDLLNNGTDLAIATTVIHESVHAVLLYILETGKLTLENTSDDRSLTLLVDSYIRFRIIEEEFGGITPPDASLVDSYMHQYMTGLVESIATSISEYGNSEEYNIAFSYYKKLAWFGLEANLEMIMFDDEDIDEDEQAELDNIYETLVDEFENRPNAKGTKCSN